MKIDGPTPSIIYKNAAFHGIQTARPQFEFAQRHSYIYYRRCEFCMFQSYKSVEKDFGTFPLVSKLEVT